MMDTATQAADENFSVIHSTVDSTKYMAIPSYVNYGELIHTQGAALSFNDSYIRRAIQGSNRDLTGCLLCVHRSVVVSVACTNTPLKRLN